MTVTIDTSALVAYLLREEGSERIKGLLSDGVESVPLLVNESCNAVLEARKQKRINREESETILQAILALSEANIKIAPQEDFIPDAFKIAAANDLTIYDSVYIALAKKTESSLASRDKKQIEVAAKLGVKILKV